MPSCKTILLVYCPSNSRSSSNCALVEGYVEEGEVVVRTGKR